MAAPALPGTQAPVLALCRDQSAGGVSAPHPHQQPAGGPARAGRHAARAQRGVGQAVANALNPALTTAPRMPGFLAAARRYALSAAGPVATSGAHFLASLLFVRNLPASEFGVFSFV